MLLQVGCGQGCRRSSLFLDSSQAVPHRWHMLSTAVPLVAVSAVVAW